MLWLGLMISIAGTQMQTWALFWHIRSLTDQPIALGGVGLARIIPLIVFSLIGGAVADVLNRRKILFFSQIIMALVAFLFAFLTISGSITLWQMYLLTAANAIAVAFDSPARQSLVPNLVPAKDLPNAFSLTSIAYQTGSIVGPAISGLVIAYLGQSYTYLINGISYFAVILALVLMGTVPQQSNIQKRNRVNLQAISEGIRFIINQPIILSTMLLDFFATFFSSANTLMPIFARDILHVGPVGYGWLSSAQSIGAVIASVIVSQVNEIRRQGEKIIVAVIIFGIATIAFGLTSSFAIAMLALMVLGASDSVSMIIRTTIRQLHTPDNIRGRISSVNQIFFMGGPQLGEIEAGIVAQLFGAPLAVISGGVGCILAAILIAQHWPQLRKYNGDEPILSGSSVNL